MKIPRLAVVFVFILALPVAAQTPTSPSSPNLLPFILLLAGLGVGILAGRALKKSPIVAPAQVDASFQDTPLPLAIVDGREKIVRSNSAFNRYLGLSDAKGRSFPESFHPDDLVRNRTLLDEVFNGERANFSVSSRFFRPDGALVAANFLAQKQGPNAKPQTVLIALEDITRLQAAETELQGARGAIHALYEVIAGQSSRDFDAKIKSLLEMGCNRFGVEIGALSRVFDGQLETLFVQSPDRRIRPRLVLPLQGAPETEKALLGLDVVPTAENWRQFPFLAKREPNAYLGAPVLVGEQLFGMLSFASLEPREHDFASGDIELLQLMAEWAGGELERAAAREELEAKQQELLSANEQLEALATHDPLTEIKNRRAFDGKLAEEWSRATRYGTPLSLVMLDVDNFKGYNDTFGHPAGDEVLKKVARLLASAVRGTDFLARYGGEEFVLLLPNTDQEGAMILAQRLRLKIEGAQWPEREVTASLGVANIESAMKERDELTAAADGALYQSKAKGRNRVTHARETSPQETAG